MSWPHRIVESAKRPNGVSVAKVEPVNGAVGPWPEDQPLDDWQVLLMAVRDRLQALVDDAVGDGSVRMPSDALQDVAATVLDCRTALDRLHGVLFYSAMAERPSASPPQPTYPHGHGRASPV
jgi:hypothetical protein